MFRLSEPEFENLRRQFGTSNSWGGRRCLPYAFTEQGVAMLSSVLRSARAVQVNIEIMRAFVRLRQMLQANAELAKKLAALEKRYDVQFRVVFDAIRELMAIERAMPSFRQVHSIRRLMLERERRQFVRRIAARPRGVRQNSRWAEARIFAARCPRKTAEWLHPFAA